jgi:hypothetical protein
MHERQSVKAASSQFQQQQQLQDDRNLSRKLLIKECYVGNAALRSNLVSDTDATMFAR